MTSLEPSNTPPSRSAGIVAFWFSAAALLGAAGMLWYGIHVSIVGRNAVMMPETNLFIYFFFASIPGVIGFILGVFAIFKARPRWLGAVAVVLGTTPLIAYLISSSLMPRIL